ncbi:MAG TPA: methyltransferase domain-containing protein [Edaphobacter sp.]|uniref:class I SAM-dependent methyltransferase n=1 Tax=Edaphobacter sp. TaxID=1934404 RepID=UPI002BA42D1C|nr:methyltransferase domain-containing protein [Edaphobacter sp.]HUZ94507.1 methyltransferase domain-containing protein [Edaphobacter sp.]
MRPEAAYRLYLRLKFGTGHPAARPQLPLPNGVLKNRAEWQQAFEQAKAAKLPLHRGDEKNWDHLAAVYAILGATTPSARVLDAGAEFYSNVLPALFAYGYRDLYGINLSFTEEARRGPIRYQHGDITQTVFADNFFDAVACMSVIEHGVPLDGYFREMYRVLKPGGLLITSTDYYPTAIDTRGKMAHGAAIKVFTRGEIQEILRLAQEVGFESTGKVDLECSERPVRWEQFDLDYSFVIFTLRKPVDR